MFYVNQRWLGGMLTNYKTIRTRIERLKKLNEMESDGSFDLLPKKEVIKLRHKKEISLKKTLGGIKDMKGLPLRSFYCRPEERTHCKLVRQEYSVYLLSLLSIPTAILTKWIM